LLVKIFFLPRIPCSRTNEGKRGKAPRDNHTTDDKALNGPHGKKEKGKKKGREKTLRPTPLIRRAEQANDQKRVAAPFLWNRLVKC